jgi:hypothetical protein
VRRPSIGRNTRRRLRVVAPVLGVAFALVGLAACAAGPGASLPVATWPVSPELLPSATSGTADANLTCGGGRTFPPSGLDAPTGAEKASGPEFDALRASLAKFGSEFPGSSDLTWRLAGRDATSAIFLARTESPGSPGWVSIDVVVAAGGWQLHNMGGSATRAWSCRRSSGRRVGRLTLRSRRQGPTRRNFTSWSGS